MVPPRSPFRACAQPDVEHRLERRLIQPGKARPYAATGACLGELQELLLDRGEQLVGGVVVVATSVVAEREVAADVGRESAGGQERSEPGVNAGEGQQRPAAR